MPYCDLAYPATSSPSQDKYYEHTPSTDASGEDLSDFDISETLDEIMSFDLMQFADFNVDQTLIQGEHLPQTTVDPSESIIDEVIAPSILGEGTFDTFADDFDLFPELM